MLYLVPGIKPFPKFFCFTTIRPIMHVEFADN